MMAAHAPQVTTVKGKIEAPEAKAKTRNIKQHTSQQRSGSHHAQTKSDAEDDDNNPAGDGPRRMLSEEQVLSLVPVSRSTLWRLEKSGKFPRSTYISGNRRVWFEDQITRWQATVDERNPFRRRGSGRRREQTASA